MRAISIFFLSCFLSCCVSAASIPKSLEEYITNLEEPSEVREVFVPQGRLSVPETFTKEQAVEDVNMFDYLLQNAYSGREFFEKRGIDFKAICKTLQEKIAEQAESIRVLDLENAMAKGLQGVFDGHLSLQGHRYHRFYKHQDVYFSDVLIKEERGGYVVIQSTVPGVQEGDRLTEENPQSLLYPTLSPTTEKHYLVGTLSEAYVPMMKVSFNEQVVKLPMHRSRITQARKGNQTCYHKEQDGVDVVKMYRFPPHRMTPELAQPYMELGLSLRESPLLVVNVLGNPGGSSEYSRTFFQSLNNVAHWNMSGAVLQSPATQVHFSKAGNLLAGLSKLSSLWKGKDTSKPAIRRWKMAWGEKPQMKGTFPGKVVVIADRGVASSGEAAVAYSRSVPNCMLVGENTAGIGTFGEVLTYNLPHSKIRLRLPCKLFVSSDLLEGRGYLPDYWLDSAEPEAEVIRWLLDPNGYRVEFKEAPSLDKIGFEQWEAGEPLPFVRQRGATTRGKGTKSLIVPDEEVVYEGKTSARFEGDKDVSIWENLHLGIPLDVKFLKIEYAVKGENLQKQAKQFNNCYVGLVYKEASGKRRFHVKQYYGSFDWKTDELQLDCQDKYDIKLIIFSSISGKFWVDDMQFTVEK